MVRFYLINTANTRVFNIVIPDTQVKLVGGDSGHVEHEQFINEVLLAPSERAVIDVMFAHAGEYRVEHRTPHSNRVLAHIDVGDTAAEPTLSQEFELLRSNADLVAERQRIVQYVDRPPDKTLAFIAEMDVERLGSDGPAGSYACPMHPEVSSKEAGHCPKCGMALLPQREESASSYACPMHTEVSSKEAGHCPKCGMARCPSVKSRRVRCVSDAPRSHL